MMIKSLIRTIPDYPKPGVLFRDITTLLKDPAGFQHSIQALIARYQDKSVTKVAAIEARGFTIGAPLAYALGAGFVPIRKAGKLPDITHSYAYDTEYGEDEIEMHHDAIMPGETILLVDDLLATGGTACAAAHLIHTSGGHLLECCFLIDLPYLGGSQRLRDNGHTVFALCEFGND